MADWVGGWDAHAVDRRAGLAGLTPMQRLEWLEQTLTLLAISGRLDADRASRQLAADAWQDRGVESSAGA